MLTAKNTKTSDTAIETRHIMERLSEHRRAVLLGFSTPNRDVVMRVVVTRTLCPAMWD